jgi:hypothetical protein
MTDLSVILELLLLLAVPFMPVAAGILLRRKFPLPDGGAEPGRGVKAWRLTGNILFWCGILAIILELVFILNYKGVI